MTGVLLIMPPFALLTVSGGNCSTSYIATYILLDSIATQVRSTLKVLEEARGKVFGKDCLAGNIVLQMNKFRYKNGKGDPRGFVAFLDDRNIARGVLPRYRGNRLHILFHIGGKLI